MLTRTGSRSHRCHWTACAALVAWPGVAGAQDVAADARETGPGQPAAESAPAAAQTPSANAVLTFETFHTLSADFDGAPGSVSVTRLAADLGMRFRLDQRSFLNISMTPELSYYNFENATGLAPGTGEPWDDVLRFEAAAIYTRAINEQWSWFAGAGAGMSAEIGADYTDAVAGGVLGGANYIWSDRLSTGLGVMVRSRIEDDILALPYVLIEWKISDKWTFGTRTGANFVGAGITYSPQEAYSFQLLGGYLAREYRLDDEGPSPEGVGSDSRVPIMFKATWNLSQQVSISGATGVQLFQEFTLDDNNGNEIASFDTDPAPFFGFELQFRF